LTDSEYAAENVDGLPFLMTMTLTVFLFNTMLLGL